jgi:hypothetical protein
VNQSSGARDRAIAACPHVDRPGDRSHKAVLDAVEVVAAVRDLDPREVWGTLALWGQADALRVYALVVALAAMVPADRPARELLEWTDALARPSTVGRAA